MALTERSFVEKIQTAIKADPALRGAVVFKHAETLTSGIPDMSISILGGTSWVEVKYLRRRKRLKDIVKELQVITCHQLATTCNGRCWIVVFEDAAFNSGDKRTVIWQPRVLAGHLWPKIMPCEVPVRTPGVVEWGAPVYVGNESDLSIIQAVNGYGAIYVTGHLPALVARLVREAAIRS